MAVEPIDGIERCAAVLQAINAGGGITVSDLARQTGISRAAVNRFVVSFVELGYVYNDPRTNAYHATSKTLELSKGVSRDEQIREAVLPVLQKTCREIGWSLNFTSIRSAQLTLIAHTDSVSPLIPKNRDNMLMRPLLGRAGGHVLLAYLPEDVRNDVLSLATLFNPRLYEDAGLTEEDVASLLAQVKADGYATVTVPQRRMNVLAVPVRVGAAVPFSLSAGIYASVVPLDSMTHRLLRPLSDCSKEISRQLADMDTERWLSIQPDVGGGTTP